MPDFEKIIQNIKAVLQLTFGGNEPPWILTLVGWLLLIGLVLCTLWGALLLLSKIKDIWIQSFQPLFYDPEEKRRSVRRRIFAKHIEHEINQLGLKEDWSDYRFAELEAEVEAEGRQKGLNTLPFLNQSRSGLRREKSLSNALASSTEKIILVEGDPGSGKSVALRHVAQMMALRATKMRSTKSIVPIYLNLKLLERDEGVKIDRELIESFVLKSLKRINDRDVEQFLDEEFHAGVQNGTWFFLFDSFDELPEVLSATEVNEAIKSYGGAIDDFLNGMNQCRGIVASRQFRGPKQIGWPRFRILSLSEARRVELIRKANLKTKLENELIGQLGLASQEVRSMASNPLFLTLLCEHLKSGFPFPNNQHTVFETYIANRFTRDEERVQRRFKLDITQIRAGAENVAFCMNADSSLGLNPSRKNLRAAFLHINMDINDNFETLLDALEYMKLARSEEVVDVAQSKSFTFAHRRFQEYFSTCVVLREPLRVPPSQLLTDGRWRETAVVMCQTQPVDSLTEIIERSDQLLAQFCNNVPNLIDNPIEYALKSHAEFTVKDHFPWPSMSIHVLSLIQDGFINRLTDLPDHIKMYASKLVLSAFEMGIRSDKKWALEVSGIIFKPVLAYLLKYSFSSDSQWLKEVAYRQAARLDSISQDIVQGVRNAIIDLALADRLHQEQIAIKAQLARLNQSTDFLKTMRLLLWLPKIDIGLHTALLIIFLPQFLALSQWPQALLLCFLIGLSLLVLRPFMLWQHRQSTHPSLSLIFIILPYIILFLRFLLPILIVFGSLRTSAWLTKDFLPLTLPIPGFPAIHISFFLLISAYVTSFGVLAFLIVQTGKYNSPKLWIFIPILPIVDILIHPISVSSFFPKSQNLTVAIITVIYTIGLFGLSWLFSGFSWFWNEVILKHWPQLLIIGQIISWIFGILFFGIGLVYLAYIVVLFSSQAYYWIGDRLKWQRWIKSSPKSITCEELCEAASIYHHASFCIEVIRFVREKRMLPITSETEAFFKNVAIEIERGQIGIRNKNNPAQARFVSYVLMEHDEVIDELFILLEDIHSAIQNLPEGA